MNNPLERGEGEYNQGKLKVPSKPYKMRKENEQNIESINEKVAKSIADCS